MDETQCELFGYYDSVCMIVFPEDDDDCTAPDHCLGYEYWYKATAYDDVCGNETIISHSDALECGLDNSTLIDLPETADCTVNKCQEFYWGHNEIEGLEKYKSSAWWSGFGLVCGGLCIFFCGFAGLKVADEAGCLD